MGSLVSDPLQRQRPPVGGAAVWALSDQKLYELAGAALPGLWKSALVVLGSGFVVSVFFGVPGVSQLAVLHIPSVWMATVLLLLVVFWSALGLLTGGAAPLLMAQSLVPTGGMFSFLAMWSGALWSRASLGAWWVGDARQMAEVLLLSLFLALLAIPVLVSNTSRSDVWGAVLGVVGGSSVALVYVLLGLDETGGIASSADFMVQALNPATGMIAAGFWLYASYAGLVRLRCMIKEREFGVVAAFSAR